MHLSTAPGGAENIIEAHGLTKSYGDVQAVAGWIRP